MLGTWVVVSMLAMNALQADVLDVGLQSPDVTNREARWIVRFSFYKAPGRLCLCLPPTVLRTAARTQKTPIR